MKVLIVDDNKENKSVLEAVLNGSGYDVESASNGLEALEKLKKEKSDIIISDILMPKMDGFQLCRECKTNKNLKAIPFVFYTSQYTSKKDELFALSLGAEKFILKPIESDQFIKIIKDVLKKHQDGSLPTTTIFPSKDETAYFREYSERVVRKLEKEVQELEESNKLLTQKSEELSKAYKKLEEKEKHIMLLLNSTAEGIYGIDTGGNCTFCNASCIKMLGYNSEQDFIGKNVHNMIHHTRPDGAKYPSEESLIYKSFREKQKVHVDDELIWRADDTGFSAEYWSYPIIKEENVIGAVVTFVDISQRKLDEFKLRRLTFDLGKRVKELECLYNISNITGKTNAAIDEMFPEIVKLVPSAWQYPEVAYAKIIYEDREFATANANDTKWKLSADIKVAGVPVGYIQVGYLEEKPPLDEGPFFREEKHLIHTIARHLGSIIKREELEKEKEKLQAQFFQAQKMESLGTLVGGITHDFNNLLQVILGYSELILSRTDENYPNYKLISEINSAAKNAVGFTRQLLTFTSKQPALVNFVNLEEIVVNLQEMTKRIIGEDIELNVITEGPLDHIKGDRNQLQQVIMNLVLNARDAMPKGGRLTIKIKNVEYDEQASKAYPEAKPGKFVCLSVADTGIGIPKTIQGRIFEPFFTTKEFGKGSGLGLSVVYGAVKQHGGWTNVFSEQGKGSTFIICFPSVAAGEKEAQPVKVAIDKLTGEGESILLVEDDYSVRGFVAKILTDNGYKVFEAEGFNQAIKIFEEEKGNFDLIFTDIVLPDKNGIELAGELASRKPGIKVLLNSGYTDPKSHMTIVKEKGYRYLQKPFEIPDLLKTVKEILLQKQ